jgi:RluA family pseudouridine synthase
MPENQSKPRSPSRRHQPRGLHIVHEDRDILVVDKVSGLQTVSSAKVREKTAYYLLNDYVRKGNHKSKNRVLIVHRLDRDTSGLIVFAKHIDAKRYLQDEWHGFEKMYYAVVHGNFPDKEGVFTSYLTENRAHGVYSIDDPAKGKLARTGYRVLKKSRSHSLLEIDLLTGRKHQIRVHLSENGCPVVGDRRYGKGSRGSRKLALHAASLTIRHPHSKETVRFETGIPAHLQSLVNG